MQKTQVRSLGQEDPLEKKMATPPVFLLRKFLGQRNLVGYSPWGHSCNPLDCSPSDSSVLGISQARCWSGLPFPLEGVLPHPETELTSLVHPALASEFFTTSTTWEAPQMGRNTNVQ